MVTGWSIARVLVGIVTAGLVGCGGAEDPSGRLLMLVPAEAELVVAVDGPRVAGTWLDHTVAALVGDAVPACVLEAARLAPLVVIGWGYDGGALVAIAGRAGPACAALDRRGADRVWAGGLDPANGRDTFFGDPERRRRWSSLPAAPVRAIADLELAAGVVVHGRATVDGSDGIDARLIVKADDRETLLSLRERYLRWRAGLDRDRLGAAWPAISAIVSAEDRADPERTTDVVELRLRGDEGATATALAVAALVTGLGGADPRLPCPDDLGDFTGRAACSDGEFTLTAELRDELQADPSILTRGMRVVPAMRQGVLAGLRLDALSAQDPLSWLGLRSGDVVESIDGQALTSPDELIVRYAAMTTGAAITLTVLRQGRRGVIRYRVR